MRWAIVTCNASRHIVAAQQHLFAKYAPKAQLLYIDVKDEPIATWGNNVAKRLPDDEYIIFGLDDFLPIDRLKSDKLNEARQITTLFRYDRFELGWGASRKPGFINNFSHLEYGPKTPYSVSCQFSIWQTTSLKTILNACSTPWDFEVNNKCKAACFSYPVFRWIEESALSKRHPGRINVLGLRPADLDELISLRLIDGSKIQYGMPKGTVLPFDPKNAGEKYQPFYD